MMLGWPITWGSGGAALATASTSSLPWVTPLTVHGNWTSAWTVAPFVIGP